jgi:HEAT repeat protein
VLGNAATPDAAHIVDRYLHDERTAVRSEAVDALRRVPTEEAERELTGALQKDADANVRATAAAALAYRKASPALIDAEATVLAAERDPQVARRLLDNLWASRGSDDSDALEAVTRAAESHPVSAIREQARTLLAQPGS